MRKELDCLGMDCPLPVIEAKKALAELEEGVWLDILADGTTQEQNLLRMAENRGWKAESEKKEDHYVISIQKGAEVSEEEMASQGHSGKVVIAIGSDKMGRGDNDELGHILMKSFIYSVTQMDPLPEAIIFYNSAVKITTEESEMLEDLKRLEQGGVEIISCGTCLNHLGLAENLKVGIVSNMYEILEVQMKAGHVINL